MDVEFKIKLFFKKIVPYEFIIREEKDLLLQTLRK